MFLISSLKYLYMRLFLGVAGNHELWSLLPYRNHVQLFNLIHSSTLQIGSFSIVLSSCLLSAASSVTFYGNFAIIVTKKFTVGAIEQRTLSHSHIGHFQLAKTF